MDLLHYREKSASFVSQALWDDNDDDDDDNMTVKVIIIAIAVIIIIFGLCCVLCVCLL